MNKLIHLLVCFLIIHSLISIPALSADYTVNKTLSPTTSRLLYGQVDIIGSSCAAAGITLSSTKLPSTIKNVRLGSPAFYANIAKEDQVLSAQVIDNKLCLVIDRNGQKFSAQLKTTVVDLKTLRANTSNGRHGALKDVLVNHDLVIIVDRSGSMGTRDCPDGMTRWQWCCAQSSQLTQAAASAASTVTLVFFNQRYDVFDKVNAQDIPNYFADYAPAGDTLLAAPLGQVLDRYFQSRAKPLIIIVITDGMPQDVPAVASRIKSASQKLHYAGEVTITFLLISDEISSDKWGAEIGEQAGASIQNGNIADIIPFNVLAWQGINSALFDELKKKQ